MRKKLHIQLLALYVSPSWVDTDMLPKEINGVKVKFPGMVSPMKVAKQAIKDAKKGKDVQ